MRTELEAMAIGQAVRFLQEAAKKEHQSLFSIVADHSDQPVERLFTDFIMEDEYWIGTHLTEGVIRVVDTERTYA